MLMICMGASPAISTPLKCHKLSGQTSRPLRVKCDASKLRHCGAYIAMQCVSSLMWNTDTMKGVAKAKPVSTQNNQQRKLAANSVLD
mgnify:FL=1